MEGSIRKRLTLTYVLIAVVCVFLISVIANLFLEKQFSKYVTENQERKNRDIVNMIGRQHNDKIGWNFYGVQNIGINALESGVIIKVNDESGKIIWNAMSYNHGMCLEIIAHMSQNMYSRYPDWEGEFVETSYPVVENDIQVGSVQIGYYGPFYYTDRDIAFLNTFNRISILVGFISVLIAIILGALMAKGISTPISRVIKTSESIKRGNYNSRIEVKSSIREINQLTSTINNLAGGLEKQESLRKQLTQDVAHELRTPLSTLQGHMEAMIDGVWEPNTERLRSCHEEIVRISRLVGDLEKLTKYEGENLILNKTSFDLSQLVKSILMNFQKDFMEKNMEVVFEEKEVEIEADRDKISQVIVNLVSNALKYTGEGGRVDIEVKPVETGVEIAVKDNGAGISQEDLPNIFERFYRADKSRNRLTGGAGIGLTITKSIVEAHGGRIEVKSKLGEGTEFVVVLPR